MDNNLPFHIRLFNDRVKTMNQGNGKLLTLNAQEARSLHAEIYDLMATITSLSKTTDAASISISMDGGGF
jgi:hypothetical protein